MYYSRRVLAQWGESKAEKFLQSQGINILAKNYRKSSGEIDLIGRDSDEILVFFEVKTRQSTLFGFPEEAVGPTKIGKITSTAWLYISEHYEIEPMWRIDIIGIIRNPKNDQFEIQWIKNVSY